jgi:prepilin-type N-terminal cleavage/methylation domain-containing protein
VKFQKKGVTLIEIIVVLIIIGAVLRFFTPNFTTPNEHAWAVSAQNNLLAIYSAEQNSNNENKGYCLGTGSTTPTCGNTLANLNLNLSLSIQDDGIYTYDCQTATTCVATRNNASLKPQLVMRLDTPIKLDNTNPTCTPAAGQTGWCP